MVGTLDALDWRSGLLRWRHNGLSGRCDSEIKSQPNREARNEQADFKPAENPARPLAMFHFEVQQGLRICPVGSVPESQAPQSAAQEPDAQLQELEIEIFHGVI